MSVSIIKVKVHTRELKGAYIQMNTFENVIQEL